MEIWPYIDSVQSTFFNQKQRDSFPTKTVLVAGGLLAYWMIRRSFSPKAEEKRARAA
jgi:hypothetical protein